MDVLDKIEINYRLEMTLAQQISQQIAWLITSGQLNPGEKLPSVRQAARCLAINMNTVRSAYQKLEADGLVQTRHGSGTQVLAYDPRQLAHLAVGVRSHTVGVIVPTLSNPIYYAFLQGVEDVTHVNHTLLFICHTHDDPEEAHRYFSQMASKQVDGMIIASHDATRLQLPAIDSRSLPFVTADCPGAPGYKVGFDLEGAGYQATRHLLEHGNRRVGLITLRRAVPNVIPVNAGYYRALDEAGFPVQEDLICQVDGWEMRDGFQATKVLLDRSNPPDAIFTISDLLALGAMQAIRQAGLQIPMDIAIAGFNDIPYAALVDPPLTTVVAPARAMGAAAMNMLASLIGGSPPPERSLTLPTSLIVRQSCGFHQPNPKV